MAGFNWVDFVLIILLLVGMAIGYASGLVRQIIGLAALYAALVIATHFFVPVSQGFASLMQAPPNTLGNAVTFFAIFFLILIVINVLALDAYKSTRIRLVPILDHMTGMILGLASMWIIVTIAVNVLLFAANTQGWGQIEGFRQVLQIGLVQSRIAEVTASTLPMIVATIRPWLPGGLPALFEL